MGALRRNPEPETAGEGPRSARPQKCVVGPEGFEPPTKGL